jgi:hypothetical protein
MAMSMGQDEDASLSSELEELIRIHFDPQARPGVRATLLSYAAARPGPVTDRVQFDLLHLSAGDADRLKRLADLAAQDARDVMSQEYFAVAGRSYPHTWARRHAVNRNWDDPPKQNEAVLATAELFFRTQPSSAGSKPELLPSLILTFADEVQLLAFADQLLTLAESGVASDLSTVVKYRGGSSTECTVLHCLRGDAPETLIHDGKVLSWDGNADYWIECRDKCLKLAETGSGFQEMIMRGTTDQQVRVSLQPIAEGS